MTTTPTADPRPSRATASDAIRRGFDSTIANWPLLLIRVGEAFLFGAIAIAAVLAVVVPLVVSAGLSQFAPSDPERASAAAEAIVRLVAAHWMLMIWSLLIASVLVVVFALVHSFVIAGTARVLVDAERMAGVHPAGRSAFSAFSIDRWIEGGRDSWWAVFWIYNLAYGAAALVVLVPALATIVVMLILRGATGAIVAGCLGLVLICFLGVILLVLTGVWCQKAIVVSVARNLAGGDALQLAWQEGRRDAGRQLTVGFVVLVLTFGGIGAISMLSILVSAPGAAVPVAAILFLPLRLFVSLIQSAYGAAAGNLGLAAFAAISESE